MTWNSGYSFNLDALTMKNMIKADARRRLDEKLTRLAAVSDSDMPTKGWVQAIRTVLGMTGTQFAARLGVSWQSMADLEKSEAAGTIQLQTLRKAAEALDCRLVYALVPKTSLTQAVETRARTIARRNLARVAQTMALEDQSVIDRDADALLDAYVRDHVRDRDIWNEK
jgi:predicted DNA-binding mobile mystery protein A